MGTKRSRDEDGLRETLAHAFAEVPYYRKRWRGLPLSLSRLPLLEKGEAISHQKDLLSGEKRAYAGTISSGTVFGERPPLRVLHDGGFASHDDEAGAELVLDVRDPHHGLPEGPPPPGRVRVAWTHGPEGIRLVESLLSSPQPDGRRFTGLIIGAGAVKALAASFLERGVDASRFGITELGTYGFRLSPTWRRVVERVFLGATLYDNYSLSEFVTPALECKACGLHHFLSPPVHVEVLQPRSKKPLSRGVGLLVLTSLYPAVRAMPLIRYVTGDLVELGPRCDASEGASIRPVGRASQCLLDRSGALLVSTLDVMDALEASPMVARHPHPSQLLFAVSSPELGAVKFELETVRGLPTVRVEVRFDPRVYPEAASALATDLGRTLTRKSPALSATGLSVEVLPPGTITKRWSKFG